MSSCSKFPTEPESSEAPIARVGEKYLYQSKITAQVPVNLNSTDSAKLSEKLINDWLMRELMVNRATQEISFDQQAVDRKVEEYRYALIAHEFEKIYVNSHLDMDISQEEINAYYSEKAENFLLNQPIVRCLFAKVPRSAPDLEQIRRNMRNYPQTNEKDIQDYCFQFAIQSFLDETLWVDFEEIIMGTPLSELENRTQFLQRTSYSETRDEQHIYFFRILEYRISNEVSPLEYIRDDIESIIINKRKLALKKELEQAIYEEARTSNVFEIFIE